MLFPLNWDFNLGYNMLYNFIIGWKCKEVYHFFAFYFSFEIKKLYVFVA